MAKAGEPNEDQKADYLKEHLPYALKMVRYTFEQMQTVLFYLDRNSKFEAFAVRARNLVNFLTNSDTGNMKACYFFPEGFSASKTNDVKQAVQKLEQQVFHLGKDRPKGNSPLKFDTEHARKIFDWIEAEMKVFIGQLPKNLKKHWNGALAVPESETAHLKVGPELACTVSQSVSSLGSKISYTTLGPTLPLQPPKA